jgi:hypothetical protein
MIGPRHASALVAAGAVTLSFAAVAGSETREERPAASEPIDESRRPADGEPSLVHGPTVSVGQVRRLTFLPGSQLYPRYLADPRQPMFKALALHVISTETPETHNPIFEFSIGASYGLVRLHPADEPELGWQLGIHMGFLAQFDPRAAYDGIGWDGYYGLSLAQRPMEEVAVRLAVQHDSAHIIDEYVRKTGRQRLGYTREEIALGVMVDPSKHVRVYGEAAYATHLGSEELAPWRSQGGLELRYRGVYAAADLTIWQEQRFRPTTTLQIGLMVERKGTGRRYGIFGQYEHGRSKLGEFYRDQQQTIGGGWWLDL